MKRLTLEDIGKLAGVSRATVSRVVNGYPHIRLEIRERVEKVIAETGFRPNAVARAMVYNRSNIIGLIVPSIVQEIFSDPYFPSLIQGVTKACGQHGQIVSLYLINNLYEEKELAENIIRGGFLDGIILALGKYDLQHMFGRIPFVTIGQPKDAADIPYVDTDNVRGGYLATKHLLELGHRRIGIIAPDTHKSGEDRLRGYQQAFAEYGVAIDKALIAPSDFSVNSAYKAMRQLLPLQPTAIFACSDRMALAVLQVLKQSNLRVPEDIAVVGFDNLSPAISAHPPLTTVHQQVEGLGMASVNLLLDILERPNHQHENIILPTELIVRDSCGAKSKQA